MKLRPMVMSLVVSGAAFAAFAAHAGQSAGTTFRGLDRNGDGYLTRNEVSDVASYAKSFDVADENRDGKLTPDEFIKLESIRERELAGAYARDAEVTAKVKTALARELELKSLDVHVLTDQGRVLLAGWVDSDAQRKTAYQAASRVEGVKVVKDGIAVR